MNLGCRSEITILIFFRVSLSFSFSPYLFFFFLISFLDNLFYYYCSLIPVLYPHVGSSQCRFIWGLTSSPFPETFYTHNTLFTNRHPMGQNLFQLSDEYRGYNINEVQLHVYITIIGVILCSGNQNMFNCILYPA